MFNERTWKEGEALTQKYMKKSGYKIVFTNHKIAGVELDIVAIFGERAQWKKLKKERAEKLKNAKSREERVKINKLFTNFKKNLQKILVIVEVKARRTQAFGHGYEAVSEQKQFHIKRGAECLLKLSQFSGMDVRFDVASVDGGKLTYIENAFN